MIARRLRPHAPRALFTRVTSTLMVTSLLVSTLVSAAGCGGEMAARKTDGLDPSTMPESIRADYQVFAERCSKCHSLSRPLGSGIDSDEYWTLYVERMRRQPGSGISREDTVVILRFLHYLVVQQKEAKEAKEKANGATLILPIPRPAPLAARALLAGRKEGM